MSKFQCEVDFDHKCGKVESLQKLKKKTFFLCLKKRSTVYLVGSAHFQLSQYFFK